VARIINGILEVASFDPTGIPGEYTFTSAVYTNSADATGNGAYDLAAGFVLTVPAADVNSGLGIVGVTHRYKITSITVEDFNHISGKILWDEDGPEFDMPTVQAVCLISEVTPNHLFSLPPDDTTYANIPPGASLNAIITDIKNITDKFVSGGGGNGVQRYVRNFNSTDWVSGSLQVVHNLNSTDVDFQVLENVAGIFEPTSVGVRYLNSTTLELLIEPTAVFTGKVVVTL
jgi:hypothetical protein